MQLGRFAVKPSRVTRAARNFRRSRKEQVVKWRIDQINKAKERLTRQIKRLEDEPGASHAIERLREARDQLTLKAERIYESLALG